MIGVGATLSLFTDSEPGSVVAIGGAAGLAMYFIGTHIGGALG